MLLLSRSLLTSRPAAFLYLSGRWALACIFLWSGLSKGYDPVMFAKIIAAYGLLPEILAFPAALLLILAEIAVGIGLLLDQKGALTATTLLILLFLAVLGYGIYLGLDIDCGCFGPGDPEAKAFHDLRPAFIRDLLLLLVIFYLYLWRLFSRTTGRLGQDVNQNSAKEANP